MKERKVFSFFLVVTLLFSLLSISINAENQIEDNRASGLIFHYSLSASKKNSSTLSITGTTDCEPTVVKCGFKNLKVQRRANSSSSWTVFYDYGNVYVDTWSAIFARDLPVDPGYQYRVTCKHYAKKNILNTQTISNTSNIVTF